MKKYYSLAALAFVAIAASAQPARDALADIGLKIQAPLEQLTTLEVDEKKLRISEDAQILAAEVEKKQRIRIKREIAEWVVEAGAADETRRNLLGEGCPMKRQMVAVELAARCNPRTLAHAELVGRLEVRAEELGTQLATVNELQAGISATVLQNSAKRKAIVAARTAATAERDRLRLLAVTEAIRRNKLKAMAACGKAACCHGVIYDGNKPDRCGIGLLCQSFQRAGLFGTNNLICVPSKSAQAL